MATQFKEYINLVGRGQRAGKTLSQAQAYDAMTQIMQDKVSPEQLGAFLMLLRVREETAEELAGFVQACRDYVNPEFSGLDVDLDMGCYAGKRRHLPWFLLAVLAMANQGLKIVIHGTAEPDSNRLYLKETLAHFGIQPATTKARAEQQLANIGFSYIELSDVHPKLDKLIQLRALFGLRSPANTLARMLNPFSAKASLHGVHHRHFDERHVAAAKLCNEPNVACFRGEGGEIEFNPERDVNVHFSRQGIQTQLVLPSRLEGWQIKPRELVVDELSQVWTGLHNNQYAEQAIIGTIAIMLLLTQPAIISEKSNVNTTTMSTSTYDVDMALEQAELIWKNRNKTLGPLA